MSDNEDRDSPEFPNGIPADLEHLNIDQRLISAAQTGSSQVVIDLLTGGARVTIDQVCFTLHCHNWCPSV